MTQQTPRAGQPQPLSGRPKPFARRFCTISGQGSAAILPALPECFDPDRARTIPHPFAAPFCLMPFHLIGVADA